MLNAISMDYLKQRTPSIFTAERAMGTSDKYKHISTIEVVKGLMAEGFMPVKATQSRTRSMESMPFTKHMLRFRHVSSVPSLGGLFPELILVNSHDGLSSYQLMAGLYRLICSNGLVAGETFQQVRVRHQGDVVGNVINGTYEVMRESKLMLEHAEEMSSIQMRDTEKLILAEAAHQLRFDERDVASRNAIKPERFLSPHRYQDVGKHDLFTVFNIIQENTIKGGMKSWGRDENGRVKRVLTREIKSIDQNNALNRALWTLAEKMMELKRG